jgi:hypothetical protein
MHEKDARVVLMTEYQVVSRQYQHWDIFFWTKAQFFVTVQGVTLLATAGWLIQAERGTHLLLFTTFLGVVTLNLFLCHLWYRNGCRNRMYMDFTMDRALQIEKHPVLQIEIDGKREPLVKAFHYRKEQLANPRLKHGSSHYLELFMPIAFAMTWFLLLAEGIWVLNKRWYVGALVALLVLLAVCALVVVYIWRVKPPRTARKA